MGLFSDNNKKKKKKELSEKELKKIRRNNKAFDFGLTGMSDDNPDKWIYEMAAFDMLTDDEEW